MFRSAILVAIASAAISVESEAQIVDKAFVLTVPVRLVSMDPASFVTVSCMVRTGTAINGSNTVAITLDATGNYSGNVVVEVPNSSGDPALANAYECRLGVVKKNTDPTKDVTDINCRADLGSPTAVETFCRSKTGTTFVGTVSGPLQ